MADYHRFSDLAPELQQRVLAEIAPQNPEAWIHQPLAALYGRTFLEVVNESNGDELVSRYLSSVAAAQATWRLAPASAEFGIEFRSRVASLTAGITAALLLVIVGFRAVQDLPLIQEARTTADPMATALLVLEIGPLTAGAILSAAAAVIGWMTWFDKTPRRWPGIATFGVIIVGGIWVLLRTAAIIKTIGWLVVVLGVVALIAQIGAPEKRAPVKP